MQQEELFAGGLDDQHQVKNEIDYVTFCISLEMQ